ncbi:unnamed protein product [Lactuca saligna]|uniref:Uncharacterized protein n=1 Tax=Lactuca saligna TaxID=75948 RepID=A0AA35YYL0_LACSI|nr:unnamed protein product [Lactuca saligna]
MIFGDDDDDDLGGFTYRPFQIRTESEDEATVTKRKLKSLHEKIDQLLLASKNMGAMFKTEKTNLEMIRTGLQQDYVSFQTSFTSQITKHHDDLAMESKVMDALARKTEKVKVLDLKLQQSEKKVQDFLSKRVVVRSCISDVTGLLLDIIQTRESMIFVTIQTRGRRWIWKVEPPKVPTNPIFKKEPKGKEKLIKEEPIIDDDEDEEPDEAELKRFRAFVKVVNAPFTKSGANQLLFSFYLKHMKPQYETWSVHKKLDVNVNGTIETESFPNAKFKVARGSACLAYEFTLADLPCLNPND